MTAYVERFQLGRCEESNVGEEHTEEVGYEQE